MFSTKHFTAIAYFFKNKIQRKSDIQGEVKDRLYRDLVDFCKENYTGTYSFKESLFEKACGRCDK